MLIKTRGKMNAETARLFILTVAAVMLEKNDDYV